MAKIVVCISDSSKTMEGLANKLGLAYAKIGKECLAKNKLTQAGAVMAWYKTNKAPYFFDAGIPVAKKPASLGKGMFIKETKTDSATVVHFFGPYNLLHQAYTAVKERSTDLKHTINGAPFEIYIGDPIDKDGNPIDPYKVRTDVVFPWH